MTKAEFVAGLRRVLDWPELDESTALKGTEKWDSLAQVDVVMFVQDELGHTLSTAALQQAATVKDVIALLDGQLT